MIIGIAGPINAGKDTLGLLLQERIDSYVTSFAEPIRNLCAYLGYNWADRERKEREHMRSFACLDESIQQGIEYCLGHWEDNDKAMLYAFLIEDLSPHVVRGKTTFDSDSMYISPRTLMQRIGTAGKKVRSSIWIDEVLANTARHEHTVLTDVRYPEEADICDHLIYIYREEQDTEVTLVSHESESYRYLLYSMARWVVPNVGGIKELNMIANTIAKELLHG